MKSLATFNFGNLAAVELQHEEAESRRKIALLALRINSAYKARQSHKAPAAISFSPFQNASSRLTLVLWPARTIERLTTGDFMKTSPICGRRHTDNKKLVCYYGRLAIILKRDKNHTNTALVDAGRSSHSPLNTPNRHCFEDVRDVALQPRMPWPLVVAIVVVAYKGVWPTILEISNSIE
jgi:hypothetical protein